MRKYIPDALSISRIGIALLVLPAAGNVSKSMFIALVFLVIAAIATDWADGYLARRWNLCTDYGYVLDAMGDRAIHLALTLVVLVRYQIVPAFVWLLVFRDILIYAIRVMSTDWLRRSREIQWISRVHATSLRVWLCSYFLRDGVTIFTGKDPLGTFEFELSQTLLISATIALSYWGIGKSLLWLLDHDPMLQPTAASQK